MSGFLRRWRRRLAALPDTLVRKGIVRWNRMVLAVRPRPRGGASPEEREVLEMARIPTDISRHLPVLFRESVEAGARLIVELGTRGGDSTRVFTLAARLTGATVVSVDIEDCSDVAEFERWHFVQADDLAFAKEFAGWCRERGLPPAADVLFVDTTHQYGQTRAELEAWMPFLAPAGRAIFHDSNQGGFYRRGDFTLGLGPGNDRGVIRALEEFLGVSIDEKRPLKRRVGAFEVIHDPLCNGLTILRKVDG